MCCDDSPRRNRNYCSTQAHFLRSLPNSSCRSLPSLSAARTRSTTLWMASRHRITEDEEDQLACKRVRSSRCTYLDQAAQEEDRTTGAQTYRTESRGGFVDLREDDSRSQLVTRLRDTGRLTRRVDIEELSGELRSPSPSDILRRKPFPKIKAEEVASSPTRYRKWHSEDS